MEQLVTTQVVLKLPGGKDCGPFSISCTSEVEVLDELPKLFTVAARQPIPGTKFFVDTPQSVSHIFVTALSTMSSPLKGYLPLWSYHSQCLLMVVALSNSMINTGKSTSPRQSGPACLVR